MGMRRNVKKKQNNDKNSCKGFTPYSDVENGCILFD